MMRRTPLIVLLLGVSIAPPTFAKDPAWNAALDESLQATYKLSKFSGRKAGKIKEPGTVLVVQKDGLRGIEWDGRVKNVVRDSEVQTPGKLDFIRPGGTIGDRRTFKVSDKLCITDMILKDEEISFGVITFNRYDVYKSGLLPLPPIRYTAEVQFKFAKGQLDTTGFSKVKAAISTVLEREEDARAAESGP